MRTDVTKLTVVFRNFSNAPKNYDTQLKDIKPHTNIRCHFTKLRSTFPTATVRSDFPLLVIHCCSNSPAGSAATAQLFCPQGELHNFHQTHVAPTLRATTSAPAH